MRTSPSSSDDPGRDDLHRVAADALARTVGQWHPDGGTGCALDGERAAHIVVDAVCEALAARHPDAALRHRLRRAGDRIANLEELAELVRHATVWDYAVYDDVPDEQWLAIDRDDYQRLADALAGIDLWRPWETPLERRLT